MRRIWQHVGRPLAFRRDAEEVHHRAMTGLRLALGSAGARRLSRARLAVHDPRLSTNRFGVTFPNPVGLAAGFDKEGVAINPLGALGFGFIEIGTLTAKAQPGNPQPRLFRLPEDTALLNRMGFNNRGATWAAETLAEQSIEPVLGINIGKSKVVPLDEAVDDYLESFELLHAFARYVVVNVSSPNTPGLRELQDREPLTRLLEALQTANRTLRSEPLPILLKIAPDLTDGQLDDIAEIVTTLGLAGLIATNTTIRRDLKTAASTVESLGAGGVSGAPLTVRSREMVAKLYTKTEGKIPLIGVGGIMNDDDAWEMIRHGASLLQVYTGFIYGGPTFARDLNRGILKRLDERGLQSIDEVVGEAARG